MGARSVSEVLTDLNICTEAFTDVVKRVISQDNFISNRLLKKSKAVSGGDYIKCPLDYKQTKAKTMSEYQEISLAPEETLDEARYNWKWINDTVTLSEKKGFIQNAGKEQIINLMEHKYKMLAKTFKDKFEELLFSESVGADDPDSLYTICALRDNTVGAILCTDTTLGFSWKPEILDLESDAPTWDNLIDPTSGYYIEDILRTIVGRLSVGNDKPTIAVTTQVVWDAYEAVLRKDKRWEGNYNQSGDIGFDTLNFRGMLIAVDENVPGGALNADDYSMMYILNENYLGFRHRKGYDFTSEKWKKPTLQHVYFSEMNWWGGFVCSRRDKQGCIKGLPIIRGTSLTLSSA